MEQTPDPLKPEKMQISAEVLERARKDFADINALIDSVETNAEGERLNLIWATLNMKVNSFLQSIAAGSGLHIKSMHASLKAAVDMAKAPAVHAFESDVGHTFGPVVSGFESFPEAVTTEGIKKILEFVGQIYEAGGRFERAYFLYKASYPEKYKEKIDNVNPDDAVPNYRQYYKKRQIGAEEQRETFNRLMEEIKDDPIMQIDAKKEMIGLLHECKKIVDEQE